MSLRSSLEFCRNGFNYRQFRDDKIIWEQFIAYQSITLIKDVFVLNSRDYWFKVEEAFGETNYKSKDYKCPAFDVIVTNSGRFNDPIRIYDEEMIISIDSYQINPKASWIKKMLHCDYIVNPIRKTWLDDNSNIQDKIDELKQVRMKMISEFNNWATSNVTINNNN